MDKNKDKKQTYVLRVLMMISTVVLIILFFATMYMVGKIQGTARVVNYAGLVRGKTQRIIKMEDAGQEEDAMIDDVAAFIDGLRNGSDSLNLVRLDDYAFQSKMEELDDYFQSLEQEIYLVREKGYENSEIIAKSEQFFQICDEATGLAEAYSQRKASALNILEKIVMADIAILIGILGIELFKALRYAAQNRILQKKVYLDEATGLPNKNKCEEILNDETVLDEKYVTAVCVFDLNNLRTINNNLGHDKGDEYIRSFAQQMRLAVPEQYFAGRNGGDEFLAVLTDVNHTEVEECLEAIRRQTEKYSRLHPAMPISYAAGYALSSDFKVPRCGVCSGMQIKTCILIKTVPRCRRLQKAENEAKASGRGPKEGVPFFGLSLLRCPAGSVRSAPLRRWIFSGTGRQLFRCGGADRERIFNRRDKTPDLVRTSACTYQ